MSYGHNGCCPEAQKSTRLLRRPPQAQPTVPWRKRRILKKRTGLRRGRAEEGCEGLAEWSTGPSLLKQQPQTLPFLEPRESPAQPARDPSQEHLLAQERLQPLQGYLSSIGAHLFEQEARMPMPAVPFTASFGPQQRARCVELMAAFCRQCSLRAETLLLAVGLFQRLCGPDFQKYHLALRLCTCLFMAAKYEEIAIPKLHVFAGAVPAQRVENANILRFEAIVLAHLDFRLSFPSPLHFADLLAARYSLPASFHAQVAQLCLQSIRSERLWQGPCSLIALACLEVVVPGRAQLCEGGPEVERELGWRCEQLVRCVSASLL